MGIQPIRKTVIPEIPDKLYFRIGDVARLCEVPAYVLRFWETEFPQLKPNKGGTGQRLYRRRDVEMALRIKSLLYDQGYTIPGARQVFKNEGKPETRPDARVAPSSEQSVPPAPEAAAASRQPEPLRQPDPVAAPAPSASATVEAGQLRALRAELQSLLELLSQPPGESPEERRRGLKALPTLAPAPVAPVPMRPRLVLEPRARVEPQPQPFRLLKADQPELFSFDSPDEA